VKLLFRVLNRWPWLAFALIGYYLPWVYHRAAGLTFNAYDLAEWVSLSPEARGGGLPLLIPFLLRFALVGIALMCGIRAAISNHSVSRGLYMLLALVLTLNLLPPVDFFKGASDDPNYRQQFILAIGTLISLGVMVFVRRRVPATARWNLIALIISFVAGACALAGNLLGLYVVQSLKLDETLGSGMLLYVACMGMAVLALTGGGPEGSGPT